MAKKAVTTEDFQSLADASTGLVAMKFLKATITEKEGDIRGYEPSTAFRFYNADLAEPLKGFSGSTRATARPPSRAAAPATAAGPDDLDDDEDEDGEAAPSTAEIPDNWRQQHHLALIRLAERITGAKPANREAAVQAIEAEETRRASGPHAVTSASLPRG